MCWEENKWQHSATNPTYTLIQKALTLSRTQGPLEQGDPLEVDEEQSTIQGGDEQWMWEGGRAAGATRESVPHAGFIWGHRFEAKISSGSIMVSMMIRENCQEYQTQWHDQCGEQLERGLLGNDKVPSQFWRWDLGSSNKSDAIRRILRRIGLVEIIW